MQLSFIQWFLFVFLLAWTCRGGGRGGEGDVIWVCQCESVCFRLLFSPFSIAEWIDKHAIIIICWLFDCPQLLSQTQKCQGNKISTANGANLPSMCLWNICVACFVQRNQNAVETDTHTILGFFFSNSDTLIASAKNISTYIDRP